MAAVQTCPDVPTLERFFLGQIAEPELGDLVGHLEGCSRCLATLQTLQPQDTLAQTAASLAHYTDPAADALVQRLMTMLRQRPPSPTHAPTTATAPAQSTEGMAPEGAEPAAEPDISFLAPAQQPDELGRLGPYRVLEVLGSGGMGVVFKAEDARLRRLVALKAMKPAAAAAANAGKRFLREARAMAAVKHDHIATIYQVDEDRGVPYLAMELLDGQPLDRILKRAGKLPVPQVVRIGREVAAGLAAAHARGLIHRDIKPGNLWLEAGNEAGNGRVKILDFGLARRGELPEGETPITRAGALMGTPAYMAPEQAGGGHVDARADLFSLGCVLYHMATGAPPFQGTGTMAILTALATRDPVPPAAVDPQVPAALSDLIVKLLAKDPADRPASADAVVESLTALAKTPPTPAPTAAADVGASPGSQRQHARPQPASRAETRVRPPRRRRRWLELAVASVILGVAIVAGNLAIHWLMSPPPPACIVVVGARYDANLLFPPNVLGWKGLEDLEAWTPHGAPGDRFALWRKRAWMRRLGSLDQNELTRDNSWAKLKEGLPDLRGASFPEDTLVVFLSLFGATDANGAPVLFADDPQGKTVVPVQVIIDDLTRVQKRASTEANKKAVVLLVDAVPAENHWPLGIFGNSFVAGLRRLEKDLAPGMYVICACAEGQRSWASEELRGTAFGHYVVKGLRGGADQDRDRRVTLAELSGYVDTRVNGWVLANRDVNQTPVFLGDREAAKEVVLARVNEGAEQAAPGKTTAGKGFEPSSKLLQAWRDWQRLKEGMAWVHQPHLWRQYQDALLRWEYLERCDCRERLGELRELVDRLKYTIEAAPPLKLTERCLSNSLAFAEATGRTVSPETADLVSRLWSLWSEYWPDEAGLQADKRWQAALAGWNAARKSEAGQAAAYARLLSAAVDALLDQDIAPSRDDFGQAAAFIKKFTEPDLVRPIEAHVLVMLDQGASPKAPPELLREALRVRRLAERVVLGVDPLDLKRPAAPSYREFVFPLVKSRLEQADRKRHDGEDFLLGDGTAHWDEARQQLKAAADQFAAIQRTAGALRRAMAARDRGWAELPYLAQWLSHYPVGDDPGKDRDAVRKDRDTALLTLSSGMAALARLTGELEKLSGNAVDERLPTLGKLAAEVTATCDELGKRCLSVTMAPTTEVDPLLYHRIEAVLRIPWLDAKQRIGLIQHSRALSAKLNQDTAELETDRRAIEFAAAGQLEKLARQLYAPALAGAGTDSLLDGLASLPGRIQNLRDQSLEQSDLSAAKQRLRTPMDLCRLIPGGRVAESEVEATPFTAPEAWRRLHACDMLTYLANRTYADHWYKEDEATPYYKEPAVAFAKAALKLAQGNMPTNQKEVKINEARMRPAEVLARELAQPVVLTVKSLSNKAPWTTERSFTLHWTIGADGKVPPGIPMTEIVFGDLSRPRQSLTTLWQQGKDPTEQIVSYLLKEETDKPKDHAVASARLSVRYRGQRRSGVVAVAAHPPNLVVQRFTPQHDPRVAVSMEKDLRYGALSIVLDTSGSMAQIHKDKSGKIVNGEVIGDPPNRRYDYAVKALDDALREMPELEYLSLIVFDKSEPTLVRGPQDRPQWDAGDDKLGPRRMLNRRLEDLPGNKKGQIYPGLNNASPIVRAIEESMRQGFPKVYDGPKVVLVLTDGADNYSFPNDNGAIDPDTKRTRPQLVRELLFKDLRDRYPGISVVTVCFLQRGSDLDSKVAEAQFREKEDVNEERSDRRFRFVADGAALARELKELLRPRLQFTAKDTGNKTNLDIYRPGAQFNWSPMDPAQYRIDVPGSNLGFGMFSLAAGQNTLLTLRRSDKLVLERGLVAEREEVVERLGPQLIQRRQDWYATLYKSDRFRGALDQVLLLEKALEKAPAKAGVTAQRRPEMVWLDVPSDDKEAPAPMRWRDDPAAAAPAYRLSGPWADDRPVRLSSYWQERFPTDPRVTVRVTAADAARTVKVGKTWFKIESIGVEPMPGQSGQCLALRVAHDIGNPVWIRLDRWGAAKKDALHTGGWRETHEHQYFPKVGRYTVRFYAWQGLDHARAEFQVLCVNSFKSDSATRRAEFAPTRNFRPPEGDLFYGPSILKPFER